MFQAEAANKSFGIKLLNQLLLSAVDFLSLANYNNMQVPGKSLALIFNVKKVKTSKSYTFLFILTKEKIKWDVAC